MEKDEDEYFELLVDDYIFDGIIEDTGNYIEIYIGQSKNRIKSCIHISVKKNNPVAILQRVDYDSKCELNNRLQSGIGTYIMVKTALKFVIDKYRYIQSFELCDKTQTKQSNINITAKRLLLGKPGWYEQHFGAIIINEGIRTDYLIATKQKLNLTDENKTKIQEKTWGTDEDFDEMATELNLSIDLFIGTSWKIDKNAIIQYDINYEIRKIQKGGGKIKEKLKKILRRTKVSRYSKMHL